MAEDDAYTMYPCFTDLRLDEVARDWPGALESLDVYWPEFAAHPALRFVDAAEDAKARGADVSRRSTRLVATAPLAYFDCEMARRHRADRRGHGPYVERGGRRVVWRVIDPTCGAVGVWSHLSAHVSAKPRRPPRLHDREVALESRAQAQDFREMWAAAESLVYSTMPVWRGFVIAAGIPLLPRAWNLTADSTGMLKKCKCCGATWYSDMLWSQLLVGWSPTESGVQFSNLWSQLRLVGYQNVEADDLGPAERYELRDCACGSTLAMPVEVSP